VTYPNVLVLKYLQSAGQPNPELEMRAEKYVGTGYQRLLTFEVDGGGFSLFGDPPAQVFLTAYGLMQLDDMAQVYPVDRAVIERAAMWLFSQQRPDGTWHVGDRRAGRGALGATSYVAWALVEAGYQNASGVERAISYIRESAVQEQDAYSLALAANALAAYAPDDATTRAVLDRLYAMRIQNEDAVFWPIGTSSFMGATGQSGSLETTALAAYALMRAQAHPDAAAGALVYLVKGKDPWGTWGTTQATILSLRALLLANEQAGKAQGPATVRVSLNGEPAHEIAIDQANQDVVHLVTFDQGLLNGENRLKIEMEGSGNLAYQVTTRYYLPWSLWLGPEKPDLLTLDLAYDRTSLSVNDEVTATVDIKLNEAGTINMALVDLGVPPGFDVLAEDLSRWVEQGAIARYELTGRQVILYLENFSSSLRLSYRLRARFPMRVQTPPSSAYDYYNPSDITVRTPLEMMVSE
jgi:uncharacterized protein YfaS (alpha-2-macroglobulin family)